MEISRDFKGASEVKRSFLDGLRKLHGVLEGFWRDSGSIRRIFDVSEKFQVAF